MNFPLQYLFKFIFFPQDILRNYLNLAYQTNDSPFLHLFKNNSWDSYLSLCDNITPLSFLYFIFLLFFLNIIPVDGNKIWIGLPNNIYSWISIQENKRIIFFSGWICYGNNSDKYISLNKSCSPCNIEHFNNLSLSFWFIPSVSCIHGVILCCIFLN